MRELELVKRGKPKPDSRRAKGRGRGGTRIGQALIVMNSSFLAQRTQKPESAEIKVVQ